MEIQFDKDDRLGDGGYGSVFSGKFKNRDVAVKRVELIHATDNEEALKQLDHPNVVKLFHVECTDDFKYFVLELCDASLDQMFLDPEDPRKYNGPELPHHLEVFLQLASGLEYIHSNNLIHRDIKPGNVLISVDSTGQEVKVTMKWADFGLSRTVNERGTFTMNSGVKGSKMWYAPELLELLYFQQPNKNMRQQPRGNVKSDVFALGLVFAFLILDGQHLYGSTEVEILKNIMEKTMININSNYNTYIAKDLIQKMLKYKPEARISSSDIVEQLKSIKIKIEEKELEMSELCEIKAPVVSTYFLGTDQNEKSKILIQQGVSVTGKDSDGINALHYLCRYNSGERLIDAINLLIQRGIDVNGKDKNGWNALHLLCGNNSSEKLIDAIKLLIQLGIDVNGKDKNGSNALHLLCQFYSREKLIDAIKLLIEIGIDVNGKNNDGWNALHLLCSKNSTEQSIDAIKLLIQLGIDVNGKDKNGNNALHYLCANNSSEKLIDAIKLLNEKGIDVNGKNNYESNALHFLCQKNSSEKLIDAINLLIQLGVEVNGKDNKGWNALHILCRHNSSRKLNDAIKLLIQLGIDVKWENSDGRNALHLLFANNSSEGLIDAIQTLTQYGFDVTPNFPAN